MPRGELHSRGSMTAALLRAAAAAAPPRLLRRGGHLSYPGTRNGSEHRGPQRVPRTVPNMPGAGVGSAQNCAPEARKFFLIISIYMRLISRNCGQKLGTT